MSGFISRALALALCAISFVGLAACENRERVDLSRALTGRGKIAVLGGDDLRDLNADAAQLIDATKLPELRTAFSAADGDALATALVHAGIQNVLVDARPDAVSGAPSSIAQKLAHYARAPGFTGVYLSPLAAFYTIDPTRSWSPALRSGLAEVARRLVAGAEPPRLTSFPDAVRRVEPVEVMVLLRSGKSPRLWRSARGSSFARALLTAASVARKRWAEREQAMGGSLDSLLPQLTVEVSLLEDDGELGSRSAAFVDRVIGPEHGVAYERKGAWRYNLPEVTHEPKDLKPSAAYARLFAEDGLPEGSLSSPELRPYRMAVRVVGISEGKPPARARTDDERTHDAISDVAKPSEVLGDPD